jgi:hypothetical protein
MACFLQISQAYDFAVSFVTLESNSTDIAESSPIWTSKQGRTRRGKSMEFIDMYHLLISLFAARKHQSIYLPTALPVVAQLISVINLLLHSHSILT